jgi:PERQ amino acid-rich with GYF domain-containing protein
MTCRFFFCRTSFYPSPVFTTTELGWNLLALTKVLLQMFSTDVNSPLKPPTQKEGSHPTGAPNGRKPSVSHGTGLAHSVTSPTTSRPSTRRRETNESAPFPPSGLISPTGTGRFSREDSSWFGRKGTEGKETEVEEPEEELSISSREPVGGKASFPGNTRGNSSTANPASSGMWGPPSASASGLGSFGNFALPTSTIGDKRFGGTRGESRLAHLIPKDSSENIAAKSNESANPDLHRSWRSRPRTDTDPFGDEGISGSAALGGGREDSPPPVPRQVGRVDAFDTPVKGSTGDFGMSGLVMGSQAEHSEAPVSPSETNPYRSPPAERGELGDNENNLEKAPGAGSVSDHQSGFGTLPRGFNSTAFDGSDRSQTSSVGPKGYSSLSNLTGWPAGPATSTPDRERAGLGGFAATLFGSVGEQHPGGMGGLGGVFGAPGSGAISGVSSVSRASKLGSLFPAAMQAQMQAQEHDNLSDSIPDIRQSNPLGAIGRAPFGASRGDTESPLRGNRGTFEDLFPTSEAARSHSIFSTADQVPPGASPATQAQPFSSVSATPLFGSNSAVGEPPQSQVRQMVMPDRMRWVYLDPQGHVQGPFTGLEMNDWYKANFFTPDLRVKKVEDPEFEPLGQLIRRIGNSREPFLVPQIGIAHGPPAQTGPFSPSNPTGIMPPLSGVFPSYGRTLTAEEQNNLERRKQEEQYIMAQQREFLLRQQLTRGPMPPGPIVGSGSLHHHSSAHSLQSQPSFGSMTSPIGMQNQQAPIGPGPMPAAAAGFFEHPVPQGMGQLASVLPGGIHEDDLANLNPDERQVLAALQGPTSLGGSFPPHPAALQAVGGLRNQLPGAEQLSEDDEGFRERLKEFEQLRAEHEAASAAAVAESARESTTEDTDTYSELEGVHEQVILADYQPLELPTESMDAAHSLSLSQQVQEAQAAAAKSPAVAGMPMPFPPPAQSSTPLPAPTAQRARSNLPEQYSRSQSGTPEITTPATTTPSVAPWAKELGTDNRRGPSLKEIQEAESRKAAKAEEEAAAARRAALDQEAASLREREKAAAAIAPGLPTSSTWGSGSPVSTTSPWTKPPVPKASAHAFASTTTSHSEKKKTLAEIQREEELKKQRVRESSAQAGIPQSSGKRYADLASKSNVPVGPHPTPASAVPAGWATVGAGGKVKIPTGPAAQTRSASATIVKPVAAKPVSKPPTSTPTPTVVKSDPGNVAIEEFNKWLHRELARGITGGIDSKFPIFFCT